VLWSLQTDKNWIAYFGKFLNVKVFDCRSKLFSTGVLYLINAHKIEKLLNKSYMKNGLRIPRIRTLPNHIIFLICIVINSIHKIFEKQHYSEIRVRARVEGLTSAQLKDLYFSHIPINADLESVVFVI